MSLGEVSRDHYRRGESVAARWDRVEIAGTAVVDCKVAVAEGSFDTADAGIVGIAGAVGTWGVVGIVVADIAEGIVESTVAGTVVVAVVVVEAGVVVVAGIAESALAAATAVDANLSHRETRATVGEHSRSPESGDLASLWPASTGVDGRNRGGWWRREMVFCFAKELDDDASFPWVPRSSRPAKQDKRWLGFGCVQFLDARLRRWLAQVLAVGLRLDLPLGLGRPGR